MTDEIDQQKYRLLAFGIERKGLRAPSESLSPKNYTLAFEPFETPKRLNQFDGAILFQGTLETFAWKEYPYAEPYLAHSCAKDELDKRKKEAQLLINNGGFICFLLSDPFIEHDKGRTFEATDFSKVFLNYASFYRKNFASRVTKIRPFRDEFRPFFELYGAANSFFQNNNDQIELRVLAKAENNTVSMVLFNSFFFVPCLIPDNNQIDEFFSLLCDALVSTRKKIQLELPAWANNFRFDAELPLFDERRTLVDHVETINRELTMYEEYKRILLFDGDLLVESTTNVLKKGFGFRIDASDEFKEDLKALNNEGKPIILFEVKGTNGNVKREHVNQADSHRERAGLPSTFPTILLINTHIKGSRNLSEKDRELVAEQVKHATKINVLMIRTLDLLNLLKLYFLKSITKEEILELFTKNSGWLKVTEKGPEVLIE
jgi:hypothetical protein